MKPHELLILSGKGGTGKTTVTGSFAHLAENPIIVDCDVDASDLHLLLNPSILEKHPFISGQKAVVDSTRCSGCGICEELCQFDAISMEETAKINPMNCEGCSVCAHFCPEDAIKLSENHCGKWYISNTAYSTMVHSQLFAGEENSGKLVSFIKHRAKEAAMKEGAKLILIDGAPGIGCPVIASISGCDTILAVTEPSLSGWHDLERILDLAEHFKTVCYVCINKYDLNHDLADTITENCKKRNAAVIGMIPFDPQVVACQIKGIPVVKNPASPAGLAITAIWKTLTKKIESQDSPSAPTMFS
jgi:MinD superfamily P-loop ATPase